jgi:hypothetical protein
LEIEPKKKKKQRKTRERSSKKKERGAGAKWRCPQSVLLSAFASSSARKQEGKPPSLSLLDLHTLPPHGLSFFSFTIVQ